MFADIKGITLPVRVKKNMFRSIKGTLRDRLGFWFCFFAQQSLSVTFLWRNMIMNLQPCYLNEVAAACAMGNTVYTARLYAGTWNLLLC